ncbi:CNNM domain-containing protein [Planctomycetota bacterium]
MDSLTAILVVVLAALMAGLFAGAETGMYQLSRIRLRLAVEKKQGLAPLLARTLQDGPGLLVVTLVGTNIAIHLATSTVTMQMMARSENAHSAEWMATLITTPILFVFSELIPKNFFLFRADTLMPLVSPILFGSYQVLRWCGVVGLLQIISSFLARLAGTPAPSKTAAESMRRHEIAAILKDTQDEGFLTGIQTGMMNRLVVACTTPVKAVMTRFKDAEKVEVNCTREQLQKMLEGHNFTRVLVYRDTPNQMLGFVNVYQVLVLDKSFTSLESFIKPLQTIDADTPVTDAIDRMQRDKLKILLVTHALRHKPHHPVGLITMKDLAEELLGELAVW